MGDRSFDRLIRDYNNRVGDQDPAEDPTKRQRLAAEAAAAAAAAKAQTDMREAWEVLNTLYREHFALPRAMVQEHSERLRRLQNENLFEEAVRPQSRCPFNNQPGKPITEEDIRAIRAYFASLQELNQEILNLQRQVTNLEETKLPETGNPLWQQIARQRIIQRVTRIRSYIQGDQSLFEVTHAIAKAIIMRNNHVIAMNLLGEFLRSPTNSTVWVTDQYRTGRPAFQFLAGLFSFQRELDDQDTTTRLRELADANSNSPQCILEPGTSVPHLDMIHLFRAVHDGTTPSDTILAMILKTMDARFANVMEARAAWEAFFRANPEMFVCHKCKQTFPHRFGSLCMCGVWACFLCILQRIAPDDRALSRDDANVSACLLQYCQMFANQTTPQLVSRIRAFVPVVLPNGTLDAHALHGVGLPGPPDFWTRPCVVQILGDLSLHGNPTIDGEVDPRSAFPTLTQTQRRLLQLIHPTGCIECTQRDPSMPNLRPFVDFDDCDNLDCRTHLNCQGQICALCGRTPCYPDADAPCIDTAASLDEAIREFQNLSLNNPEAPGARANHDIGNDHLYICPSLVLPFVLLGVQLDETRSCYSWLGSTVYNNARRTIQVAGMVRALEVFEFITEQFPGQLEDTLDCPIPNTRSLDPRPDDATFAEVLMPLAFHLWNLPSRETQWGESYSSDQQGRRGEFPPRSIPSLYNLWKVYDRAKRETVTHPATRIQPNADALPQTGFVPDLASNIQFWRELRQTHGISIETILPTSFQTASGQEINGVPDPMECRSPLFDQDGRPIEVHGRGNIFPPDRLWFDRDGNMRPEFDNLPLPHRLWLVFSLARCRILRDRDLTGGYGRFTSLHNNDTFPVLQRDEVLVEVRSIIEANPELIGPATIDDFPFMVPQGADAEHAIMLDPEQPSPEDAPAPAEDVPAPPEDAPAPPEDAPAPPEDAPAPAEARAPTYEEAHDAFVAQLNEMGMPPPMEIEAVGQAIQDAAHMVVNGEDPDAAFGYIVEVMVNL